MSITTHPGTYWKYLKPIDGRVMTVLCCPDCWHVWHFDTSGITGFDGGFGVVVQCPRCDHYCRYVNRKADSYGEKENPVALPKIRRRITRKDREVSGGLYDGHGGTPTFDPRDGRPPD